MSLAEHPIKDVGISGIEVYFPKNFVSQSDMEKFDGCSAGKYTIGLGQEEMGFCADNEDIVSIALTVTDALLRSYSIDPNSIGFLAVGTETIIDKSKSVKTELMRLFGNNNDIEGVDVKNACFGGTQAVFHAVDWIYANYLTERRNAIVVLADVAVYEAGPARCTGGAGAIAVLITPDAPIAFDRGLRATYMTGTWDFYKPIGKCSSEYPIVDGPLSLQYYMKCLDAYISLSSFSAAMFHSPFSRMVQKALARYLGLREWETNWRRLLHRTWAKTFWKEKTYPFLELNRRIGNMYTSSLFAQLIAYLASGDNLNRILFFAYGSGSASAMFSASISGSGPLLAQMQRVSRLAASFFFLKSFDSFKVCLSSFVICQS
uniref:Hydroxymethylglutaryl-CoA synthase n=1 Tax=Angiostrongylus cantonensis TaxID=6313 RepID=A0A0K0DLD7_ANGCA